MNSVEHLITLVEHDYHSEGDYTLREWYLDRESKKLICKNKSRNSFTTWGDMSWTNEYEIERGLKFIENQLRHQPSTLRELKLKLIID